MRGNFVITQLDQGNRKGNFLKNEDCEGVVILRQIHQLISVFKSKWQR